MKQPAATDMPANNPMGDGPLASTLQASGLLSLPTSATPEAIQSSLGNLRDLANGLEPADLVVSSQGSS